MGQADRDATQGWVTASDLAEYAYCPRAQWYRHHPPEGGPTPDGVQARIAGTRYHAHELAARSRRERHIGWWWLVLAVGAALCAVAVLGGLHP